MTILEEELPQKLTLRSKDPRRCPLWLYMKREPAMKRSGWRAQSLKV
jgi:ribosomal protein L39E